jgi:Effector Associated Constant Component 1
MVSRQSGADTAGGWGCGAVVAQMRVYLDDGNELQELREWMGGHSGIRVEAVPRPAEPHAQGSVWDFLSVLCEAGGPVAAAVRALQLWIESRVTVVEIVVGEKRFTVRTTDAATVLPQVERAAANMLEPGESHRDDPS